MLSQKNILRFSHKLHGCWWKSKSAPNQSRDILLFWVNSTLFMSQFTMASLIFELNLLHEKQYVALYVIRTSVWVLVKINLRRNYAKWALC